MQFTEKKIKWGDLEFWKYNTETWHGKFEFRSKIKIDVKTLDEIFMKSIFLDSDFNIFKYKNNNIYVEFKKNNKWLNDEDNGKLCYNKNIEKDKNKKIQKNNCKI